MWRGTVSGVSDRGVWVEVPDLAPGSLGPLPVVGGAVLAKGAAVVVADLAGGGPGMDLVVLGALDAGPPTRLGRRVRIGQGLYLEDNGTGWGIVEIPGSNLKLRGGHTDLVLPYGGGVPTTNHGTAPTDGPHALVTKDYVDALVGTATAWDPAAVYHRGDMVTHAGRLWGATGNTAAGDEPGVAADWEQVTLATLYTAGGHP